MEGFKEIILEENFNILYAPKEGGQAKVFIVEQKDSGQKQVLKIYFDTDNFDELIKNVSKEFDMLLAINHVNVVKAYEKYIVLFEGKRLPALSMEYVEGDTLADFLKKPNTFINQELFLKIAIELTAGLKGCHRCAEKQERTGKDGTTFILSKGLIHNDIHLGNIIIRQNDKNEKDYVLIDFGLSFLNQKNENIKSGTLPFSPPEKFLENEKITHQSDVYSLGVIFFNLITGQLPFEYSGNSNNLSDIIQWYKQAHTDMTVPSLYQKRLEYVSEKQNTLLKEPDFAIWIQTLILKCLAKDPSNRFRDAGAINDFLRKGIKGELSIPWRLEEKEEEQKAWNNALSSGSIQKLEAFINKYANSDFITKANKLLMQWKAEEEEISAMNLTFNEALKTNSKNGYQQFLNEYPSHPKKEIIITKLKEINEEISLKDKLLLNPTKKGFQQFQAIYPNSNFNNLIKSALLKREARKQNTFKKIVKISAIAFIIILISFIVNFFYQKSDENDKIFENNKKVLNAYYHIKESNQLKTLKLNGIFGFPLKYFGSTYKTSAAFKKKLNDKNINILNALNKIKNKKYNKHYSFSKKDKTIVVIITFSKKDGGIIDRKEIIKLQNNKIISVEKE